MLYNICMEADFNLLEWCIQWWSHCLVHLQIERWVGESRGRTTSHRHFLRVHACRCNNWLSCACLVPVNFWVRITKSWSRTGSIDVSSRLEDGQTNSVHGGRGLFVRGETSFIWSDFFQITLTPPQPQVWFLNLFCYQKNTLPLIVK